MEQHEQLWGTIKSIDWICFQFIYLKICAEHLRKFLMWSRKASDESEIAIKFMRGDQDINKK